MKPITNTSIIPLDFLNLYIDKYVYGEKGAFVYIFFSAEWFAFPFLGYIPQFVLFKKKSASFLYCLNMFHPCWFSFSLFWARHIYLLEEAAHQRAFVCFQGILGAGMEQNPIFSNGSFIEKPPVLARFGRNSLPVIKIFLDEWRDFENYWVQTLHFKNQKTEA